MLSSKAKYALRAARCLAARHAIGGWTLTAEIAADARVPRKFLESILVELRNCGLVESARGRYGGYRLARPPAEIAVSAVIRSIDGPLALTPCSSRTRYGACEDCVDPAICALRPVLQAARDAVADVLEKRSLADLLAPGPAPGPASGPPSGQGSGQGSGSSPAAAERSAWPAPGLALDQ